MLAQTHRHTQSEGMHVERAAEQVLPYPATVLRCEPGVCGSRRRGEGGGRQEVLVQFHALVSFGTKEIRHSK